MRKKIFTSKGRRWLVVQVPDNFDHGFISKTGKSFVFRVKGSYMKSNGDFIGETGKLSEYISIPIGEAVEDMRKGQHYHIKDADIKHNFGDDIIVPALTIEIKPQVTI